MQNVTDSEYIGWTEEVISQWEEGIYLLPMWHQSMYIPHELWVIHKALKESENTSYSRIVH